MAEVEKSLHIVMLPWLAMGHLIPFHNLSISLALKGHKISFISTPRNLERLPPTPKTLNSLQTLDSLLTLIPFPLPTLPNRDASLLPPHAESSIDISYPKHQLLKAAFDLLEPQVSSFLESSKPDWVIFDYTAHWLPKIATELGIKSCFFSLFSASLLGFIGPPGSRRTKTPTIDDFVNVPKWVPFESNIAFRPYEVTKYVDRAVEYDSVVTPDSIRFEGSVVDCDVVAIRTCVEFEPEWLDLLRELYKKPVIPVGVLPPIVAEHDDGDEEWVRVRGWLDSQSASSVVYVALGSEAVLSQEEIQELALGLEKAGLPFFWVLRDPPESTLKALAMLPPGFLDRVEGRAIVYTKWAPQARILSHDSVGGFLTHCGCNSYIEGLAHGRVLILLPFINDQGLNARQLEGKKFGIEVSRDEKYGSFSCESVAEAVLVAMVGETGESIRASAKEAKGVFGNLKMNDNCVDEFVAYLAASSRS